ncbi:cardiolipin synthase [Clostridium sp. KNHs214]|uniref:cardiolipin synthase n=1 Tax=Clostridium sp. KNHs214 TaxID=1540257 RepID=UPI00054E4EC1|nr:cardiolipin synthase [Clostridium sp. KNHs214]
MRLYISLGNLGLIIFLVNILLAIFLIFFERRNPSTTWAWLLILIFFPIVGFIVYLFFGQNLSREKIFNKKIIKDNEKSTYLKKLRFSYKYDIDAIENADTIRMLYKSSGSIFTQNNHVQLYFDGEEKFEALFSEIKNAKKFIHIEYYIIQKDTIGLKLINALTEKAKEGVEIKLLFDAMGSRKITPSIVKPLIEAGGKVFSFFPSKISFINRRINYRNHRKIVVIDSQVAFLGGFNIGNEYISKDPKIGYWRDTHIKIMGEAINDLEERFLLDWTYASNEYIDDYSKYFISKTFNEPDVGLQIVSSGPDLKEQHIRNGYIKIINHAKNTLYLQSPYFVPDDSMLNALKICALSGKDVRIMIPGNPDHIFMGWAANAYIKTLLDCGIKVYLYNNGFIHCKTIMADGSVCSIGTANMDIRSFKLNFETNAFIYNRNICTTVEKQFLKDMEYCTEVTLQNFQSRPLRSKIFESITRLLSPIL